MIEGCMAGYVPQQYNEYNDGTELKNLVTTLEKALQKHSKITQELGFLDKNLKATKLAKKTLIIGLEIQYHKCYGDTPEWKLNWYDDNSTL